MIRPLLLLVGTAAAAFPGCAPTERAFPPSAAPAAADRGPSMSAPPPSQAVRDRAALAEACRRDAERVVLYRDRGQLMREDERDARIGTDASIYARRVETDRLGRAFERDRIAAECLREEMPSPSPRR